MAYTEEQKREHVRELQEYLHGISHTDESYPHVIPDGIYGENTTAAVNRFQQQNQLRPTGETNTDTWNAIVQQYQDKVRIPTIVMSIFPAGVKLYTVGDKGTAVFLIQALLRAIEAQFENMPEVHMSGIYDTDTQRAIQHFKQNANLTPTGDTDPNTWNHLIAALASELEYFWR